MDAQAGAIAAAIRECRAEDRSGLYGRLDSLSVARDARCALHGEDAGKVWRDLTARADRSPIPVTSERFGRRKPTGSYLRWFGFAPDPGPGNSRWLTFAEAVDKARHGDGSGFADAVLGNAAASAPPWRRPPAGSPVHLFTRIPATPGARRRGARRAGRGPA